MARKRTTRAEAEGPRVDPIAQLVEDGAVAAACRRAEGEGLAAELPLLRWLADQPLLEGVTAPWSTARAARAAHVGEARPEVALAVHRHLARGLVRACDLEHGPGALLGTEPPALELLAAELPAEAAEALFATLSRHPRSAAAALGLGNALHRLGRTPEARDHYRRALRVGPQLVPLEAIEDPDVRGLATVAAELRLPGDARIWMPICGVLEDVLPLSALDPVPGNGFGDGTRAFDLLIAHKGAKSPAERAAVRRDLQLLAPALFAALQEAQKLDLPGGRPGSA